MHAADLRDGAIAAVPGVPSAFDAGARARLGVRHIHEPLAVGVAVMAARALPGADRRPDADRRPPTNERGRGCSGMHARRPVRVTRRRRSGVLRRPQAVLRLMPTMPSTSSTAPSAMPTMGRITP